MPRKAGKVPTAATIRYPASGVIPPPMVFGKAFGCSAACPVLGVILQRLIQIGVIGDKVRHRQMRLVQLLEGLQRAAQLTDDGPILVLRTGGQAGVNPV